MKILVYHIGSLGDTLVSLPALWAIRDNFPGAHVTMLSDEQPERALIQASEVLDNAGLIDDYIVYPAGVKSALARILWRLRKRRFNILIYLIRPRNNDKRVRRDKLFFRLAGIRRFIGMRQFRCPHAGMHSSQSTPVPRMADIILKRLGVDGLKIPPEGKGRLDPAIGRREEENVQRWLAEQVDDGGRKWFAIALGSKMPCKVWPFERYLSVAQSLVKEYKVWPIAFGGPGDRDLCEKLIRELRCGYVAAGAIGCRDSMAVMQRCLFFIGNDTGTMHMAAASGLRCVVPFSSRDLPGLWYPYGEGHAVFRTPIDCEGCMLEECSDRKMECLLSISTEQVLDASRKLLCEAVSRS